MFLCSLKRAAELRGMSERDSNFYCGGSRMMDARSIEYAAKTPNAPLSILDLILADGPEKRGLFPAISN